MPSIDIPDLEALAIGAGLLGSGGGGKTDYPLLMAREQLKKTGLVELMSMEELRGDDLIVPLAFIGAPLAGIEKISSLAEFPALLEKMTAHFGRRPTAVISAEIGGANAFTGILGASLMGVPLLDADLLGRAFPELQMASATLAGVSASPVFLADALGNTCGIQAMDGITVERMSRHVAVAMGSTCLGALYTMSGSEASRALIPGSLSRALSLGTAVMGSSDPISSLCELSGGRVVGEGILTEIHQEIAGGFLQGSVCLEDDQGQIEVKYQNEYLLATKDGRPMASTPDILTLVDAENGRAIASEALTYGLRAKLLALPAPRMWTTKAGLDLVGPRVFGYDVNFEEVKV